MSEHTKLVNALLNAAFHQGDLERDETAPYRKLDKAAEYVALAKHELIAYIEDLQASIPPRSQFS